MVTSEKTKKTSCPTTCPVVQSFCNNMGIVDEGTADAMATIEPVVMVITSEGYLPGACGSREC